MDLLSAEDREHLQRSVRAVIDGLPIPGERARMLREQMHAATTGGKGFRPALVVASFRAFSTGFDVSSALWNVAAAYELLHAAFVVHDDIIDADTFRRGTLNVRGSLAREARRAGSDESSAIRIGDAGAILVGDLLLYAATRTLLVQPVAEETRQRLLTQMDEAIAVSAAGEWADASQLDLAEHDALAMTADKTAVYSFCSPMRAGAVVAGADLASEHALASIGRELGIAFQLVDDLIGAFGTEQQAGREVGADLREGKRTPLVALAHESAAWREVAGALALAHTGPLAVALAQRELERSGARDRLLVMVDGHLDVARDKSMSLPIGLQKLVAEVAREIEDRIPSRAV